MAAITNDPKVVELNTPPAAKTTVKKATTSKKTVNAKTTTEKPAVETTAVTALGAGSADPIAPAQNNNTNKENNKMSTTTKETTKIEEAKKVETKAQVNKPAAAPEAAAIVEATPMIVSPAVCESFGKIEVAHYQAPLSGKDYAKTILQTAGIALTVAVVITGVAVAANAIFGEKQEA